MQSVGQLATDGQEKIGLIVRWRSVEPSHANKYFQHTINGQIFLIAKRLTMNVKGISNGPPVDILPPPRSSSFLFGSEFFLFIFFFLAKIIFSLFFMKKETEWNVALAALLAAPSSRRGGQDAVYHFSLALSDAALTLLLLFSLSRLGKGCVH